MLSGALLIPPGASAQTISGRVVQEGNPLPVAAARVSALRLDRERQFAITDSVGLFRMVLPEPGQYRLRVQHISYLALDSEPIDVAAGEIVRVELRVAVTTIPLEPLTVVVRTRNPRIAEFHDRRLTRTSGRFITRDEIDRRPLTRTTDLLRSVPGVQIVEVRRPGATRVQFLIRLRDNCEPAVFVDGVAVTQAMGMTVDDLLNPDMLEGVEIYTSTTGVPVPYMQQGGCGAVLFWTRAGEPGTNEWNWKVVIGSALLAALTAIALAR